MLQKIPDILERMKLTFWGAAQVVTGSMHQLVVDDQCYLLDCGEYQGRRKEAEDRNRNFPFPCKDVSAVMLSHAHIDHSGNLPLLVKNGFHGPIYTSAATADLCRPMLADAASLQEHDAAFLNKRNLRRKSLNLPGHRPGGDKADRAALYN
jgi:metallo-beta-lactamase family protein